MEKRTFVNVHYKDSCMFAICVKKLMSVEDAVKQYLELKDLPLDCPENQRILSTVYGDDRYPFIGVKDGIYFIDVDALTFGKLMEI